MKLSDGNGGLASGSVNDRWNRDLFSVDFHHLMPVILFVIMLAVFFTFFLFLGRSFFLDLLFYDFHGEAGDSAERWRERLALENSRGRCFAASSVETDFCAACWF